MCTLHIINKKEKLNKLYKQIYPLLIVFGDKNEYKDDLVEFTNNENKKLFLYKIIHLETITSVDYFNNLVNDQYIDICKIQRDAVRPIFSIFTPAFNSFEKIMRAFVSLKTQTLTNWEWVIMDDSPDDKNFIYLKKQLANDSRIRLYRRFENNGYIGNVKNEAVALCRGQYVLELDHDDEILPFVLEESAKLFDDHLDVGFIYMDFINIYENGNNFRYGDNICKGYGSYYCQKYNDKWVYVYNTPNINNITLSHLVCCPNHPRIWRKDILLNIGNYCEYLPICDDYEIILRTAVSTKMAKIPKMGYIQYMNESNNNFSLIRNAEINRIGPNYIQPIYYDYLNINEEMKKRDGYEDEKYMNSESNIWKRDANYTHKFCNLLVNNDYKKQFCIIGLDGLIKNIEKIRELYEDHINDFFIVDNKCTIEYLWGKLDNFGFNRMKCYTLIDQPDELLVNYFKRCYLSVNDYEIITANIGSIQYNSQLQCRHLVVNCSTLPENKYLEIGIEYGYTFSNTHFLDKTGVDPDPKCDNIKNAKIYKVISDTFFFENTLTNGNHKETFDVIFIDGMHHCENVLRDFNNSVKILNKNGVIFMDDILPLNYNEQLKIPLKHYYENDILKYGEEWTGDVWKFVYHLLIHYNNNIKISYIYNINFRGVVRIEILEPFTMVVTDDELNSYDYFTQFNDYLELLEKNNKIIK